MLEHEYYNLHATANAGKRELRERIEALEAAIGILANRLPPADYAIVKKNLAEVGIKVKRNN